tara:strand:- start:7 stop:324 length:318 start_codon:yes stop_codon:yes gene_type:complete
MNAQELIKVLSRTEQDRISDLGVLSDHYKDIYGSRPDWSSIKDMTFDQIADAHKELSKMREVERQAELRWNEKMQEKADRLVANYGMSKEDLIRWGCFNREEIKI